MNGMRNLSERLTHPDPVDIVLIKGIKRDTHAKIEAHRAKTGKAPIALTALTIRAVASHTQTRGSDRRQFDLSKATGIADFNLNQLAMDTLLIPEGHNA